MRTQKRAQTGSSLLAVLIAAAVLAVAGAMAVGMVGVAYRSSAAALRRDDLDNYAETVARTLAAARLSGRRSGFFTVTADNLTFDSPKADGNRFRYTARTITELDVTRVLVNVYPSVGGVRGDYAQASASY